MARWRLSFACNFKFWVFSFFKSAWLARKCLWATSACSLANLLAVRLVSNFFWAISFCWRSRQSFSLYDFRFGQIVSVFGCHSLPAVFRDGFCFYVQSRPAWNGTMRRSIRRRVLRRQAASLSNAPNTACSRLRGRRALEDDPRQVRYDHKDYLAIILLRLTPTVGRTLMM